ncbi:hypothetical protein E4U42_003888 [Claviceps africana]|uniref:MYND-type domain-containing protein n=1 Tax=Claviceps africana TaxID=83212 RepID=A0A8K0NIM5_9HYPO|nr:hypothetical protein E4U42_003888 [Claviceps africana]
MEDVEPPYQPMRPLCCVSSSPGLVCGKTPRVTCTSCLLTSYCSPDCRTAHWSEHKSDCEALAPNQIHLCDVIGPKAYKAQTRPRAWAGYAATDVIHFSRQTEGLAFDGQLNILLNGVFPIRHMIYSVANLPPTASPQLKFTINAASLFDFQRSFAGIALLFPSDPDHLILNAEALIHMWYSSRTTEHLFAHAQSRLANIRKRSRSVWDSFLNDTDASRTCSMREFNQKNIKFTLAISDEQKSKFQKAADASENLERLFELCTKYESRQTDVESYYTHAARMTRGRALGLLQWRVDGLLLPYDRPRDPFFIPNPIFFGQGSAMPDGVVAEPLSEWPMEFLDHPIENFVALNDTYGRLFYYLRDLLVRFQIRCQKLDMEIELCCMPPEQLPNRLKVNPEDKFDRIEFLNDTSASPCATLLTMTRESVGLDGTEKGQKSLGEVWEIFTPTSTVLDQYTITADEPAWDVHLRDPNLFGFHLLGEDETANMESVVETGFLGLECMRKNRITTRWPNRLVHSRSDKPAMRKFNTYLGWVDNKPQRWLEWQLKEPLDEEQLDYWARICMTMTPEEMRKVMEKAVDEAQQGENAATADSYAAVNLDWIDEESNVEATAAAGKKAEQNPKGGTGGKKKKRSGKAKK